MDLSFEGYLEFLDLAHEHNIWAIFLSFVLENESRTSSHDL